MGLTSQLCNQISQHCFRECDNDSPVMMKNITAVITMDRTDGCNNYIDVTTVKCDAKDSFYFD